MVFVAADVLQMQARDARLLRSASYVEVSDTSGVERSDVAGPEKLY